MVKFEKKKFVLPKTLSLVWFKLLASVHDNVYIIIWMTLFLKKDMFYRFAIGWGLFKYIFKLFEMLLMVES